jgi:hypothetical protein
MDQVRQSWVTIAMVAFVSLIVGIGGSYWYCSANQRALSIMEQTNKVRLHSNLLNQLEKGDIEGAKAANRDLIRMGGVALDILAPLGSGAAKDADVIAARRTIAALETSEK